MHAHTSSDLMYPPLCYTLKVFPKQQIVKENIVFQTFVFLGSTFSWLR